MNKYHLFLDDEALCIEADGYKSFPDWIGFYRTEEEGTETTFPPRWKQVLFGAKKVHRRVEDRTYFHWVRAPSLRRILLASATLTEGGDAKQAPGASLSGAVPNGETHNG